MAQDRLVANGAAIRAMRQALGWRSGKFALQCGIAPSYLSNIESGRRRGSPDVLRRIASTLGVPLGAITSLPPGREGRS